MSILRWRSASRNTFALDVSLFEYCSGKWVYIVGPSGCGKSMFLRWLVGCDDVVCNGNELIRSEFDAVAVSYIGASTSLPNWLQCRSYFSLESKIRKRQANFDSLRVMFERFGLTNDCLSLRPHEMSRGMAQRVEIAIAIEMDTATLLIDEGTGGIDKRNKDNVLHQLRKRVDAAGLSIISVFNNVGEVARCADVIFYIDDGTLKKMTWERITELSHIREVNPFLVAAMSGRTWTD